MSVGGRQWVSEHFVAPLQVPIAGDLQHPHPRCSTSTAAGGCRIPCWRGTSCPPSKPKEAETRRLLLRRNCWNDRRLCQHELNVGSNGKRVWNAWQEVVSRCPHLLHISSTQRTHSVASEPRSNAGRMERVAASEDKHVFLCLELTATDAALWCRLRCLLRCGSNCGGVLCPSLPCAGSTCRLRMCRVLLSPHSLRVSLQPERGLREEVAAGWVLENGEGGEHEAGDARSGVFCLFFLLRKPASCAHQTHRSHDETKP